MPGIGLKKFKEKKGFCPIEMSQEKGFWPFLNTLLSEDVFNYCDYALAETILKEASHLSENSAALLSYLSLTTRLGHLCLRFEDDLVYPLTSDCIEDRHYSKKINEMVVKAFSCLPEDLVAQEKDLDFSKPLFKRGNLLYLQKYWFYETHLIDAIKRIESAKPLESVDKKKAKTLIKTFQEQGKLLSEQALAAEVVLHNNLSLISGGPGTGKTYTAAQIIRIFLHALPEKLRDHYKITIAAPTGKAAFNLQQSLQKSLGDTHLHLCIEAKTLHSLLYAKGYRPYISSNFILIDESAMVDAKMMAKLFASVRPGAKIVLLGDPFQLPPVEAGSIFADLLAAKKTSGQVAEFKRCMRSDIVSIIDFSKKINQGSFDEVVSILSSTSSSIKRFELDHPKKFLDHILPIFEDLDTGAHNFSSILESFNRFRILTPLRKGLFGVDTLNQILLERLSKVKSAIPIIITKNDYRLELFNGMSGVLIKKNTFQSTIGKGDLAIFPDGKGGVRQLPALLVKHFEIAYCISVHKSQGSEFDHVLVLLPQGAERFGREVLYTAVTRAKKRVELWSQEVVLQKTLEKVSFRESGIAARYSCAKTFN